MKKFLVAVLSSLLIVSAVNAAVETYEGTDEYYVLGAVEDINVARERARERALRDAREKAGVYVHSVSKMVNSKMVEDEIITVASGVLRVLDTSYEIVKLTDADGYFIRATVKADIDSDDIEKWLNRGTDERSELVAQNVELQKAIAAQDAQIAELKKQLAAKPQDAEKISEQFAAEDKVFRSNQELAEAGKFYYNGDFSGARNLCTKAIELNPDNATAYSIRGAIYYRLNDFNGAVADFNKAAALNPNDYRNFYNRGLAHVKLNDLRKAVEDFSGAIQINPNDADSYYNRAVCRQRLGDYYGSQEDLNRARALGYRG